MRTTTILVLTALLVALGSAQASAQGIPLIFCAEQDPETPGCFGTGSFESLVGTREVDVIFALAGDDIINTEDGDDTAFGGPGEDNVNGSSGDDRLFGGRGTDTLSDVVTGPGSEPTTGDRDELYGNRGDDILNADDGDFRDVLACGEGNEDVAFFDENRRTGRSDTVSDSCEFGNEPPGTAR